MSGLHSPTFLPREDHLRPVEGSAATHPQTVTIHGANRKTTIKLATVGTPGYVQIDLQKPAGVVNSGLQSVCLLSLAQGSFAQGIEPAFSVAPVSMYPQALNHYCVTCHDEELKAVGLRPDLADVAHVSKGRCRFL